MLPIPEHEIRLELEKYERSNLDASAPNRIEASALLDGAPLIRVRAITKFWADDESKMVERLEDLIAGSWSQGANRRRVVWCVVGATDSVRIYGALGFASDTVQRLRAIVPGIEMDPHPVANLGTTSASHFRAMALLRGVPRREEQSVLRLGRLIRLMRDANWGLAIVAEPRARGEILAERKHILERLSLFESSSRISFQETLQESSQVREHETQGATRTQSGEMIDSRVQHILELMRQELERLEEALTSGAWWVTVCLGAESADVLQRLMSSAVSAFAGDLESRSERVTAQECVPGGRDAEDFNTFLTSRELAALAQLPIEETPGYSVRDFAAFDTDFEPPGTDHIELGNIVQDGLESRRTFAIACDDLAKHGVVVGATGSGKSTSLMTMLENLHARSIPFCVIEPAKTEYRAWIGSSMSGMRVYTLGNENVAPFRLNPFEFETGDEPGMTSVLSHIDYLKAVFNAAFVLYAPMPYVLDIALHQIYEDKGWDLATGRNLRVPLNKWRVRHQYPIFPTLGDLLRKIDRVVDGLQYDQRLGQDIRASLKTRITSLRLGAKGLMLDTARGLAIEELLSNPTIIELESIGSDEEKTFLMGLLLVRLYEHRRLQAMSGALPRGLQHLLVVEEAHRLLMRTETQVSADSSNMRAMAVETFANMLSEMRAYGQGVVVAEQIPAKLIPDVIKNTNLKIAHRLVAQDDRLLVGATMNLTEEQTRYLGTLRAGEAAVFAEGADHSYLVKMKMSSYSGKGLHVPDSRLASQSASYINLSGCFSYPDWTAYGLRPTPHGAPNASVYQAARDFAAAGGEALMSRLILCAVFNRGKLLELVQSGQRRVQSEFMSRPKDSIASIIRWYFVCAAGDAIHQRASENGWSYDFAESLRQSLTRGLLAVYDAQDISTGRADLDSFSRNYERELMAQSGPFPGCDACHAICSYRPEVRRLLARKDVEAVRSKAIDPAYKAIAPRFEAIATSLKDVVEQWLGGKSADMEGLAYCAGLHSAAELGYSTSEQETFGRHLGVKLGI